MNCPLLIFDTHPIQYRAPVFRALSQELPGVKIGFFNSGFDGKKWWFQEVDKIPKQDFGLNLIEGYEHFFLETSKLNLFQKFSLFAATLKKCKPKAVMIYGYYQSEHWVLRLLTARYGIPLIFVGETFDWRGSWLRRNLKKFFIQFFFDQVREFISIGERTTQYYKNWGIEPQRITQAHYCTDLDPFQWDPAETSSLRKNIRGSLNIPERAFVLLFVGRLFDRKRPRDILQMHQLLTKSFPIHTIFVGNGELSDELQKESASSAEIHWVGFKNHRELKGFYQASDLLVVPSEFETWGLVVNEAFSCGLPALVTETCGVAGDLVTSGETGEIYPVGDISSAVNKIAHLIQNPLLHKQLSQNARQKVITHYRPDNFAASIFKAFQKAISIEG